MALEIMMKVEDLFYSYENGYKALKNINLSIEEGEFISLLGANGSGKTTLVKQMAGLLHPQKGRVNLKDRNLKNLKIKERASEIGFVFQNPDHQIYCSTVWDELAAGPKNLGIPSKDIELRVNEVLKLFKLEEFQKHPPSILGFGQRRAISVASVLTMNPKMIILDEPCAGLDRGSSLKLLATLVDMKNCGHTIVMISHNMRHVAEYASRCLVMHQGELIKDTSPQELFEDEHCLAIAGLKPPAVIKLASELNKRDKKGYYPLNNSQMVELL